jgi:TetR/AcrR family transcriptional repressor of nem operon
VAELMKEAGLTHGGFYRHFGSRDDLVAEAVECALAQGSERAMAAAARGGEPAFAAIVDAYLSVVHRDRPEAGCAVAGMSPEPTSGHGRPTAAKSRSTSTCWPG